MQEKPLLFSQSLQLMEENVLNREKKKLTLSQAFYAA
jgi:hypothetical protein